MTDKRTIKKAAKEITSTAKPADAATANRPFHVNLRLFCILLAVISFALYANTLNNGFALDDVMVLKENTIVTQGVKGIPELLSTPHMHGYAFFPNDTYRPLSMVMLAVAYEYFGLNAAPYHLINVLLYVACVILLFLFLDRLFEQRKTGVAFIAALVFAVHPIHTEVVANIKSCDELLCFLFGFTTLNLFINYMKRGSASHLVLGILALFLSYLSKETVVGFIVVIPLLFFFYINDDKRRAILITAGTAIATIVFILIRSKVLNEYNANQPSNSVELLANAPSATVKIATEIVIMGKYLLLLFVPYPLLCTYSGNTIAHASFASISMWLSLLAYVGIAWFAVGRFVKNKKDLWTFGVFFYFAMMLLFSNIIFLIAGTMGERLLFFGSVGFCIVLALAVEMFAGKALEDVMLSFKNPKVLAVVIPLCLLYSVITIARNRDWVDNYTLYKADIVKAPHSAMLNYYMGLELETTVVGKYEKDTAKLREVRTEGIGYLKRSIASSDKFSDAHATLGNSYIMLGKLDSAELHEKRALELAPSGEKTVNNLAYIYYREGKFGQSLEYSRKAIAMNPHYAVPHTNIARCYFQMGKNDSAVHALYMGIAADATNAATYELLALYFKSIGAGDSAAKYAALLAKYRN